MGDSLIRPRILLADDHLAMLEAEIALLRQDGGYGLSLPMVPSAAVPATSNRETRETPSYSDANTRDSKPDLWSTFTLNGSHKAAYAIDAIRHLTIAWSRSTGGEALFSVLGGVLHRIIQHGFLSALLEEFTICTGESDYPCVRR